MSRRKAGVDVQDLTDHVTPQALSYSDRFDRSNGVLIRLSTGLIKLYGSKETLDGHNGSKSGPENLNLVGSQET